MELSLEALWYLFVELFGVNLDFVLDQNGHWGEVQMGLAMADVRRVHCKCLWQVVKWSLVSPAACINEWTTVGPTNRNPLRIMSLLMLSDFEVFTGILWPNLYWVEIGLWFTNPHMYLSNEPNSLLICKIWHHLPREHIY